MSQLLKTKLFIPSIRSEVISRPRLIDQLNAGLVKKLTLISAPAGFGKTTLVCEWVENFRYLGNQENSRNIRIAWLSLDEGDNILTGFLAYFIEALNHSNAGSKIIGQNALDMLQSPHPPQYELVLTELINEIASFEDKLVLVLDDYHLIENQLIHDAVNFLLRNVPPQFHLVLVTREDPFLPLSRLRVRGHLAELRATDLRFTSSEAEEFLNKAMGLTLSQEDISALETCTEGWIAGLHLAALSLQKVNDVTSFINSFTGSHHLVLDYLIEEVLNQQSEEIQNFLMQTSILDQLTGPLCDAVRLDTALSLSQSEGISNSQEILEILERSNLFIIPLDNQRKWYRYHHLFAELLAHRLRIRYPDITKNLHARAAIWYENNGFLSKAIQHAFAGDDLKNAIRLIEKGALDALEQSNFGFIFNAVEQVPAEMQKSSPWLFVYHCWALFLTGQIAIAAPKFEETDWLLESLSDDETQIRKMQGYIAGLKTQLVAWNRDFENTITWAEKAKLYLPEHHWIRAYCAMMVGVSYWDKGNLAASLESFKEAAAIGDVCQNRRVAVTSAIYLGHTLELTGRLRKAAQIYQNAFECARVKNRELPVACYLNIDFARILYECNEVNKAIQHFTKGIQQSQLLADIRIESIGNSLLTRAYLANNDLVNAAAVINEAEKFIPSPDIVYDMRGGEYPRVRLWLKQKENQKIESWLKNTKYDLDPSVNFKTRMTYTMHARALITLAREVPDSDLYLSQAFELLDILLELAESNGWGSKIIEILALQSLAFDLAGEKKSAKEALERSIALAEGEGFMRIFLDEGPPMVRLLYELSSFGEASDYVQHLLKTFSIFEPEQEQTKQTNFDKNGIIEPLSEREIEILQLIAEGLSNQEIGVSLYLSLNTVKAHTRNIYAKLEVNSRTQAVARARSLGLLSAV